MVCRCTARTTVVRTNAYGFPVYACCATTCPTCDAPRCAYEGTNATRTVTRSPNNRRRRKNDTDVHILALKDEVDAQPDQAWRAIRYDKGPIIANVSYSAAASSASGCFTNRARCSSSSARRASISTSPLMRVSSAFVATFTRALPTVSW